jgi:HEPN domain-containing protein
VCFHCQHAAEKYLKALLQEGGLVVPRTHDLVNCSTSSCRATRPLPR